MTAPPTGAADGRWRFPCPTCRGPVTDCPDCGRGLVCSCSTFDSSRAAPCCEAEAARRPMPLDVIYPERMGAALLPPVDPDHPSEAA